MSDFVLVSQGIECDRSCNPYPIIKYAINGNRDYNKYLERCAENYERPADNEMFVYKEDRDNIEEVDLFMCEYLIRWAKEEAYDELADGLCYQACFTNAQKDTIRKLVEEFKNES